MLMRVSPFGHHRIFACLRLPDAFRCLLRPSSPLCAQASAIRPFFLDLKVDMNKLEFTDCYS